MVSNYHNGLKKKREGAKEIGDGRDQQQPITSLEEDQTKKIKNHQESKRRRGRGGGGGKKKKKCAEIYTFLIIAVLIENVLLPT